MGHEVTLRNIAPVRAAALQVTTSPQTIGEDMGPAFGALMGTMEAQGLTATDVPLCIYRSWQPENWVIDVAVPIAADAVVEGDIQQVDLPDGEAATVLHVGPYEELGRAHEALAAWCAAHGREMVASYERYLTDPGEEPDPAKYQTEVIWPLRAG